VWPRVWLTWTDGRAWQARAPGAERRPAAGRNRGLGRRRASQNRNVTPEAWLMTTDGRAGGYRQSRRRAAWRPVVFITALLTDCLLQQTRQDSHLTVSPAIHSCNHRMNIQWLIYMHTLLGGNTIL